MTMSARGSRASNASSVCASSKSADTAETAVRFTPSTAAPKTFNRRATFAPMSPMPSTSAVLPEIVSAWSYFCQIYACLLLQYRPNERYSATRLPIAYSAMIVPNAPDAFASTTLCGRFSMRVYLSAPAQVSCSRRRFSVCASWASLGSPKITAAARSCSAVGCSPFSANVNAHCVPNRVFNVSRMVKSHCASTKTDVFSFCIVFSPLSVRIFTII